MTHIIFFLFVLILSFKVLRENQKQRDSERRKARLILVWPAELYCIISVMGRTSLQILAVALSL